MKIVVGHLESKTRAACWEETGKISYIIAGAVSLHNNQVKEESQASLVLASKTPKTSSNFSNKRLVAQIRLRRPCLGMLRNQKYRRSLSRMLFSNRTIVTIANYLMNRWAMKNQLTISGQRNETVASLSIPSLKVKTAAWKYNSIALKKIAKRRKRRSIFKRWPTMTKT